MREFSQVAVSFRQLAQIALNCVRVGETSALLVSLRSFGVRYLDALISNRRYEAVAWTYPEPFPGYDALKGHFAFYPGRADAAWLDEERVLAQAGDFYGGWISAGLIGPFKGAPGTSRW